MAVPAEVDAHNMAGTYVMNKTLSDSSIPLLQMQNIPWLVQQAARYSTITVTLKQYTDSDGHPHIDQDQVSTGGIRNVEERTLSDEWGEKDVRFWGLVRGKSRFIKMSELDDEFLKQGWSKDCVEGELVETRSESVGGGWTALQIWGFADVDGERRHVRRILGKKGDEEQRLRLVYDWKS